MKNFIRIIALILMLTLSLALLVGCDGQTAEDMPEDTFAGDPGIKATALISKNEIDMLDVKITVTNTYGKEVTGLRFFAELLDGNGNLIEDQVQQIFIKFDQDVNIAAGESVAFDIMISQRATENIRLYYLYVTFSDGHEWGVKHANANQIINLSPSVGVVKMMNGEAE